MKRGTAYRVVIRDSDPDLQPGALLSAIQAARLFVHGRRRIFLDDGSEEIMQPASRSHLRALVRCDHRSGCGYPLAAVWSTPQGLFFEAWLVEAYRHRSPKDAVLMVHPDLPGQVAEVSRSSLAAVHSRKGWREAPPGTQRPKKYTGQDGIRVGDLLDFPSTQHPPLRVHCRDDGRFVLDSELVLGHVRHTNRAGAPVPLSAVRSPLDSTPTA